MFKLFAEILMFSELPHSDIEYVVPSKFSRRSQDTELLITNTIPINKGRPVHVDDIDDEGAYEKPDCFRGIRSPHRGIKTSTERSIFYYVSITCAGYIL